MKGRKGTIVALVAVAGVLVLAVVIGVYWQNIAAWIQFVRTFESTGRNEQGYAEYRHRQTGIIFVRVPGGRFLMGSPKNEKGREADSKTDVEFQHEVALTPFLIGKYEVTQAQWKRIMGANPSTLWVEIGGSNPSEVVGPDLPSHCVSWENCKDFCKRTGLNMPTEAQWEYACRAGTSGPFAGTGRLEEMGWYKMNSPSKMRPVGQKAPNGFGIYDMHGNVWEWCKDVFDPTFYSQSEAKGPDPVCTSGSEVPVVRGGGWDLISRFCRSASRLRQITARRDESLGFRPAFYPLP